MRNIDIIELRKLSQKWAYTSIRMHEMIGKSLGLPGTDHKYLGFFLQKGSMTAGEMAAVSGLSTGAVTGLIDRFEKRDLVRRKPDFRDRRKIIIEADVEKIREMITPLYEDYQSDTEQLFSGFSTSEINTLKTYFLRALDIMNRKIYRLNQSK